MNSIDQLKERLHGKTAEEAVDALYKRGALDHHLARKYVIVDEYEHRLGTTDGTPRRIQEDMAEEFGVDRRTIGRSVGA